MTGYHASSWDALAEREVPAWFHDAKLGVFIHWGPYSVPAWAPQSTDIDALLTAKGARGLYRANPYAEWYRNSYRVPGSATQAHHRAVHGDREYDDFAAEFDRAASTADLTQLAGELRETGAAYVVLTSKHHDGVPLWHSDVPHPKGRGFRPTRDLVGDFASAVRAAGMRLGLYYSGGYDWSVHDVVMRHNADALLAMPADPAYTAYAEAHVRELIDRYAPSVLWNDIGWPGGGNLAQLFSDYYRRVPEGVVNDRWLEGPARRTRLDTLKTRVIGRAAELFWPLLPQSVKSVEFPSSKHSDFATAEYRSFAETRTDKWEYTRGIGHSFALNRAERGEDMVGIQELVHGFVDVVSKNGNLLLGVGPAPDGSIPASQLHILSGLGTWMRTNEEAITGTRPWLTAEGRTDRGVPVRFTHRDDVLYATLLSADPGSGIHELQGVTVRTPPAECAVLGIGPQPVRVDDARLRVALPERLPDSPAHVIRIRGGVLVP